MFKNMTQKFNSIKIYSIARYHLWGTFGIYPKADASTQNSSSVQDKQFQKLKKYQIIQKNFWLKTVR